MIVRYQEARRPHGRRVPRTILRTSKLLKTHQVPLGISQVARPNKKKRRSLLAISLWQPGCLLITRPLGFAPLPHGRFALVQDARKYTRAEGLVAISLKAARARGSKPC